MTTNFNLSFNSASIVYQCGVSLVFLSLMVRNLPLQVASIMYHCCVSLVFKGVAVADVVRALVLVVWVAPAWVRTL